MKTKVGPAKSTEEIKDFRHCDLELGGAGVDQAVVYLFRVDYQAKELVEASRTYTDRQGGFECFGQVAVKNSQYFWHTVSIKS